MFKYSAVLLAMAGVAAAVYEDDGYYMALCEIGTRSGMDPW